MRYFIFIVTLLFSFSNVYAGIIINSSVQVNGTILCKSYSCNGSLTSAQGGVNITTNNGIFVISPKLIKVNAETVPNPVNEEQQANSIAAPSAFALQQNFPNPFNPVTIIKFELPTASRITLQIYDISGQLIRTLVNTSLEAGYHSVEWNGRDYNNRSLASGTYLYRLTAENFRQTKRLILLK